jgi:hypothetical protein
MFRSPKGGEAVMGNVRILDLYKRPPIRATYWHAQESPTAE